MEKQNNIILAPSSSQVTELYKLWRENHAGRLSDFYKFLTSPTDQRDRFQVTFFNRLIINYLHDCIAYNMPTFLIYYRLFLT